MNLNYLKPNQGSAATATEQNYFQESTRLNRFKRLRAFTMLGALSLTNSLLAQEGIEETGSPTFTGSYPTAATASANARASEDADPGALFDINVVVVTGDRDQVYALENWESYENDAIYKPMSEADVETFRQRLLKELQNEGYLFSTVSVYRPSLRLGFLKFRVHVGDKGEVTVKGNKWHSAEQVLDSVEWETGAGFNYNNFYEDLFSANSRSHVKVETEFKPRVDENGKRIVDAEFQVEERFPAHIAWEISNSGIRESSDWRSRLSVQVLNVTQADDTLTFDWVTDMRNVEDLNALSFGYFRPIGEEWAINLYGGWSESEITDVIPQFDLAGQGWFAGFNLNHTLWDDKESKMDISVGLLYQESQNENFFGGSIIPGGSRDTKLGTPRINISYSDKEFDSWGGRNYINNQLLFYREGFFATSSDLREATQNAATASNAIVDRFQFARYQKVTSRRDGSPGFGIYLKTDAQLSSDSLPSVLYKSIGGANSVRGYHNNEAVGDFGLNASLEVQSPILSNFFGPLKRDEEYLQGHPDDWRMHRLQAIAFTDYGVVGFHDSNNNPGNTKYQSIASLGAGLRLGLTKYSQMRFDYGVQLKEGPRDTGTRDRVHFAFQLQY